MMLPSHFLNVVLEEVDGDVETNKTEKSEHSSLRDLINSPLRQQLNFPIEKLTRTNNNNNINNNNLFISCEFPKRLPEAFLTECTVEVCKAPIIKKPLPEPRFEVRLLPVYSNKNNHKNNGRPQWRLLERKDKVEESVGVDALSEVEAVYSEHDSNSDEEITLPVTSPSPHPHSHIKDETLTPIKIHMCKFCHKIFPNKGVLWSHTNTAHADKLNCECPICGRVFYRNCNLAVHLKSHEVDGSENIPTTVEAMAKSSDDTKTQNPPAAPLTGGTPDRPYKCPYCTKCYAQRSVLKKHMVVHTGERLTCNLCGIDFTQKSSLLRHAKRMHSPDGYAPSYTRTSRKVPPLLNLRLTDQIKKVLAAASLNRISPPPETGRPNEPLDDLSNGTRHSNNSEETEHSVDMPERTASFIQSLKIPQGISISMIDD